jgi:hypothetical protein
LTTAHVRKEPTVSSLPIAAAFATDRVAEQFTAPDRRRRRRVTTNERSDRK